MPGTDVDTLLPSEVSVAELLGGFFYEGVSTMLFQGSVRLMKPLACHHFICRSMSVTRRRPFRSWKESPA